MSGGHSKSKSQNRPLNAQERAALFNSAGSLIATAYNPTYRSSAPVGGGSVMQSWDASQRDTFAGDGGGWDNYGTFGLASKGERNLFGKPVNPGDGMGTANPYQSAFTINAPMYESPDFVQLGVPQTLSGGDYDRLEQSIVNSRWAPLQRYEALDRQRLDEDLNRRGIYTSGVAAEAQNDLSERYLPQYTAAGAEAAAQRYGLQSNENQMVNALAAQEAAAANAFNLENANRDYSSKWAPLQWLQQLYAGTAGNVGANNQYSQNFGF